MISTWQQTPAEDLPDPTATLGLPPEGLGGGPLPAVPTVREEPSGVAEPLIDRAIGWFDETLFQIGGRGITFVDLLVALLIVVLAFQVSRFLQRLSEQAFHKAGVDAEGTVGTVGRLIHYSVITLGLLIAINQLGIKLETLLTAGAVFAVAFGFAMQNIAQNFVSGVILLIERTIKPGDVLEVEGRVVRVVEMGIRSTVARTRDEEEIIVPNSTLVQTTVKNFTLRDSVYRLRSYVGVTYSSDMELVEKTLEETARDLDWREKDRAPRIHLKQFGDSSVIWEVSVWIQNPWLAPRLLNRLNQALWHALRERSIQFAFPQLDVHLDVGLDSVARQAVAAGSDVE